jgi:hypothetical protein
MARRRLWPPDRVRGHGGGRGVSEDGRLKRSDASRWGDTNPYLTPNTLSVKLSLGLTTACGFAATPHRLHFSVNRTCVAPLSRAVFPSRLSSQARWAHSPNRSCGPRGFWIFFSPS